MYVHFRRIAQNVHVAVLAVVVVRIALHTTVVGVLLVVAVVLVGVLVVVAAALRALAARPPMRCTAANQTGCHHHGRRRRRCGRRRIRCRHCGRHVAQHPDRFDLRVMLAECRRCRRGGRIQSEWPGRRRGGRRRCRIVVQMMVVQVRRVRAAEEGIIVARIIVGARVARVLRSVGSGIVIAAGAAGCVRVGIVNWFGCTEPERTDSTLIGYFA